MSRYILKGNDNVSKIAEIQTNISYEFNPKSKTNQIIKVKKISVYDEKIIQKLLVNRYLIRFKKLSESILAFIDSDDDSDNGYMICFDEIARLKDILIYKYKKYLKKVLYEEFLKDLLFLEKYLQEKLIVARSKDEEKEKTR